MRSAAVLVAIALLAMPTVGLSQGKLKKGADPATAQPATDAGARERIEQMQRRQTELEGKTMRSICANCDVGKGTGKRKKARRRL